jgi:hypothetical protein
MKVALDFGVIQPGFLFLPDRYLKDAPKAYLKNDYRKKGLAE